MQISKGASGITCSQADTIGVIGAGIMGRGIAQLFVQAGHEVRLFDSKPEAAADARRFVLGLVDRQVAKGSFDVAARDTIAERLMVAGAMSELSGCSVVVEAIVEDLAIKQALFHALEEVVDEQTILASNTSSLLVSAIASACRFPGRVAGLHFFNPVLLMKVAEVIPGLLTDPDVTARLFQLVRGTGHRPVGASDQPGFLINHAGRALYTEGLRIVEEGVCDVVGVDRIMRESCGFRMGPFELLDLTGLDVSGKVMQSIFEQFQHDPRYRPSSLVPPRIAAGLFGRKTKRGFYNYPSGERLEPPEPPPPEPGQGTLWIGEGGCAAELTGRLSAAGVRIAAAPDDADALLVLPWGEDVTGAAVRLGLDPVKLLALDPLIPWEKRQVLMRSPVTDPAKASLVHGWLSAAGGKVTIISDSVGLVAQRVLSMIVNTGCEIAQRGVASPEDIDAAVRIGLGYPSGPLAWGDTIGPARVLAILHGLQAATGDPRYRPSLWLRRRALLGLSLTMADHAGSQP